MKTNIPLTNEAFLEYMDNVIRDTANSKKSAFINIEHSFVLNKDEAAHVCSLVKIDAEQAEIIEETQFFVVCAINGLNYFVVYPADGQYTETRKILEL